MSQKNIHILILMLFILAPACSLMAESLTWGQAVKEAIEKNPTLEAGRHNIESAKQAVTSASSGLWPNLGLNGNINRSGSQPLDSNGNNTGLETDSTSYSAGASANWKLFDGFYTWNSRHQAEMQLVESQANYQQTSVNLRSNLMQAFNRIIYDQLNLVLLESIKERLNQDTRYIQMQYKSGREAHWAYLQAEAEEAQIAWQTKQSQEDLDSQQKNLAYLLGRKPRDIKETIKVSGNLETPEPPEEIEPWYERMYEENPALMLQKAIVEAAEAAMNGSLSTRYPSLNLNSGYNYSDGSSWPPTQSTWKRGSFHRFQPILRIWPGGFHHAGHPSVAGQ